VTATSAPPSPAPPARAVGGNLGADPSRRRGAGETEAIASKNAEGG